MLSSIQGMTKFDNYDPLAIIPQEDTLDWAYPRLQYRLQARIIPIRISNF